LYSPYDDSPTPEPGAVSQLTAVCTDAHIDGDTELLKLLGASTTYSTRRAYESDLRHFAAWRGPLPATALDVARYLAAHSGRLSVATLDRRLVAIGQAHALRGLSDPTKTDLVRRTMRGVRRTYGVPQRRVAALTRGDLLAIAAQLGDSLQDLRDRALLLVGFAGAFRRSELVGMDYDRVHETVHGLTVTIARGKTDQEGHGREVLIPFGSRAACPVKALHDWLSASGIAGGAVFRSLRKENRIGPERLSPEAVAVIIKCRAKTVGLDPALYSGHSLRAGFATSAATIGMPTWEIKAQMGHTTDEMAGRYIRQAALQNLIPYRSIL
jgi:integrase